MNQRHPQSTHAVLCPYCGHMQQATERCEQCAGLFEPLSRMATQIAMGPWFIRDEKMPYAPGCSYQIVQRKAQTGKLTSQSIIRGPGTHQFWMYAHQVPGIAHLIGVCHQCGAKVSPTSRLCPTCHAPFDAPVQRDALGLQYPTDQALEQAQLQLQQLKSGQSPQTLPSDTSSQPTVPPLSTPAVSPAPITPPPARDKHLDAGIGLGQPVPSNMPLPDTAEILQDMPLQPSPKLPQNQDKTSSLKTSDLKQQASHLSVTVIVMIICILVLGSLIVMMFMASQKPGGITGKEPIKRELGTSGALREETLPMVEKDQDASPQPLPDPVGSLDLHQSIGDARALDDKGQTQQALAKLREYAQTLGEGELPFDLETEIKRLEQKIAREKAASFFGNN